LRDPGERVLDARSALRCEDADRLAVRRAADTVGDPRADTLLAADDGTDAEFGAAVDQQVAGITDEMLDALGPQGTRDRLGYFDCASSGI
jgi:hypothetical protein